MVRWMEIIFPQNFEDVPFSYYVIMKSNAILNANPAQGISFFFSFGCF
jgi:hypothetical protein